MRRLARGIYTPNLQDAPEVIVQRNRHDLLDALHPGLVVSHRSAIEIGAAVQPHVWLSGEFAAERKRRLPGLVIHLFPGSGPVRGDIRFRKFHIASQPRYFLENLSPSRGPEDKRKALSRADLERRLADITVSHGAGQLNRLRDEARAIAPELGLEKEAAQLDSIIGALLGTQPDAAVSERASIARAQARPYDVDRVRLLEALALALREVQTPEFRPAPDIRANVSVLHTFAFMEAYFSNFIEGTEFEVDEAKKVVFEGLRIPRRQDDTHDILNTYRLVVDTYEMSRLPGSPAELLELLRSRHLAILDHRRDKNPGNWKDAANRVGGTRFVEPTLVEGSLLQAFNLYIALPHALGRAIFMQIAIAEVHPFNDGNGRVSRAMMNAELTRANECRIIIPTVYRDDYLTALKAFSQNRETAPVIRMFERAQAFTASMDYTNYEGAKESFSLANAFRDPREGKLIFQERRR
ncbi:MAG TPA: Fic family protein [Burkholderiales bacterium]|nr:Fic family protein [Burkholderiales bacterium]